MGLNVTLSTPRKLSNQPMIPPGGSDSKFQFSYPLDSNTKATQFKHGDIVLYKKGGGRRLGKIDFTNVSEAFRNQVLYQISLQIYLCSILIFLFFEIYIFRVRIVLKLYISITFALILSQVRKVIPFGKVPIPGIPAPGVKPIVAFHPIETKVDCVKLEDFIG